MKTGESDTALADHDLETIVADLAPGQPGGLARLFKDNNRKPPVILWDPSPDDAKNPLAKHFAACCDDLTETSGRIRAKDFDMAPFQALHNWMMVLAVEDTNTFRYLHYGKGIADIRGVSMQGQTTDAFGGYITQFFTAVYQAVLRNKRSVLTVHEPPLEIFARSWERLIVPLFSDDLTDVTKFVVLNVPDNELRPGLEIIPDPVLIADAGLIVRYANRRAREMFDRQIYQGSDMDLFTFAGIDLDPPASPAELAQSGAVHDVISLVLSGTMIERFLVTVSGTDQWGRSFYVITLRPALEQSEKPEPA